MFVSRPLRALAAAKVSRLRAVLRCVGTAGGALRSESVQLSPFPTPTALICAAGTLAGLDRQLKAVAVASRKRSTEVIHLCDTVSEVENIGYTHDLKVHSIDDFSSCAANVHQRDESRGEMSTSIIRFGTPYRWSMSC
eukprot:3598390-Amphidinium_carterae.1